MHQQSDFEKTVFAKTARVNARGEGECFLFGLPQSEATNTRGRQCQCTLRQTKAACLVCWRRWLAGVCERMAHARWLTTLSIPLSLFLSTSRGLHHGRLHHRVQGACVCEGENGLLCVWRENHNRFPFFAFLTSHPLSLPPPQTIGDLTFYAVGGLDENEVVLSMVLTAFYESVSLLLRCVWVWRGGETNHTHTRVALSASHPTAPHTTVAPSTKKRCSKTWTSSCWRWTRLWTAA